MALISYAELSILVSIIAGAFNPNIFRLLSRLSSVIKFAFSKLHPKYIRDRAEGLNDRADSPLHSLSIRLSFSYDQPIYFISIGWLRSSRLVTFVNSTVG